MPVSAVFILALTVRLVALWVFLSSADWRDVGYGSELGQIAANLAEGRGFSSPFDSGSQPSAWLAPLIPLIWAAVFKVMAVFSQQSLVCLGVLQCIVSAGACCFYYLILRCLVTRTGKDFSGWFWGGMVLLICWPLCIKAAITFWYFAWQECAVAGFFWASLVWLETRTWRIAVLLGLLAGVVALINPVPLVLLVGVVGLAWNPNRISHWFLQVGLIGCIAVACMVPWIIRNAAVFGAFVPLRSSFGVELFQGNNSAGAIVQTANSIHPALRADERARFLMMGEREYNQAALKQALVYIRDHPRLTAKRVCLRIYAFWCSDIFGNWPWVPDKGMQQGPRLSLFTGAKAVIWVGPLLTLIWLIVTGRISHVPYWGLFVTLFVWLPLPYYLTHVSPMYAYALQPYLILTGMLAVSKSKFGSQ